MTIGLPRGGQRHRPSFARLAISFVVAQLTPFRLLREEFEGIGSRRLRRQGSCGDGNRLAGDAGLAGAAPDELVHRSSGDHGGINNETVDVMGMAIAMPVLLAGISLTWILVCLVMPIKMAERQEVPET